MEAEKLIEVVLTEKKLVRVKESVKWIDAPRVSIFVKKKDLQLFMEEFYLLRYNQEMGVKPNYIHNHRKERRAFLRGHKIHVNPRALRPRAPARSAPDGADRPCRQFHSYGKTTLKILTLWKNVSPNSNSRTKVTRRLTCACCQASRGISQHWKDLASRPMPSQKTVLW